MNTGVRLLLGILMAAALAAAGVAMIRHGIYGWTVFMVAPGIAGGLGVWIFQPSSGRRAAGVGALSVLFATCLLLLAGLEGAICILMTLPLAMPIGAVGGLLVHQAMLSRMAARGATMLLLLPPAAFTWDVKAPPAVYAVRTEMVVAAPRERVWKHVVKFADLPEPNDWYFRAGLAYPKRARIQGEGPGAIRYCEFSTGPFVEPIEVWDEPRLLAFQVTENPAPMHEWSPYANVLPRHLHGYLVSKRGQFRLTALPDGRTLLEGTTWYQHGLWPGEYWRWWSDAVIHRIHLRVLNHVRTLAEQER